MSDIPLSKSDIPLSNPGQPLDPQDVGDLGASNIAQSGDNFSSGLEGLGDKLLDYRKFQSQTDTLNQMTSLQNLIGGARASMYSNPTAANIKAQQSIVDSGVNTSLTQTNLLPQDKARLGRVAARLSGTFDDEASIRLRTITNKQLVTNFQNNFPAALSSIHDQAANGEIVGAQAAYQSLKDSASNLVQSGAMPSSILSRINNFGSQMISRGYQVSQMKDDYASTPDHANLDLALGLSPTISNDAPQRDASANLTNSFLNSANLSQAKSDAVNGKFSSDYVMNPKVSDADVNHYQQYYNGAAFARSDVMGGLSYNQLVNKSKTLAKMKQLSGTQEGARDGYNNALNLMKNDYFTYYTTQTNNGKSALQELNDNVNAASQSAVLSNSAKQSIISNYKTSFANQVIAYARAHQIPSNLVKPFPQNDPDLINLQNSFSPGQSVETSVNFLRNNRNLAPYYSGSMQTNTQQEAAHLATLAPDFNWASLLMSSNQAKDPGGKDQPTILDPDDNTKELTNTKILGSFTSNPNIQQYLNYVSAMPNSNSRAAAIQTVLTNTVKSCMLKNSNNTLDKCAQYINDKGVPQSEDYAQGGLDGGSYNVLKTQLHVPVSDADVESLSDLALQKGYAIINKGAKTPENENNIRINKVTNGLQVMSTPVGSLYVFNPATGQKVYELPVDNHVVAMARQLWGDKQKAMQNAGNPHFKGFGL